MKFLVRCFLPGLQRWNSQFCEDHKEFTIQAWSQLHASLHHRSILNGKREQTSSKLMLFQYFPFARPAFYIYSMWCMLVMKWYQHWRSWSRHWFHWRTESHDASAWRFHHWPGIFLYTTELFLHGRVFDDDIQCKAPFLNPQHCTCPAPMASTVLERTCQKHTRLCRSSRAHWTWSSVSLGHQTPWSRLQRSPCSHCCNN